MAKKKTESEDVIDAIENAVVEGAEKTKEVLEEVGESVEKTVKKAVEKIEHALDADDGEKKETTLADKKRALLERAAKLKEKVETVVSEDLKEKVKPKKETPLLPLEDYVKSGIYIGTKVVTPDMRKYVYRRRADGLAILNTDLIDRKIKEGISFLCQFNPDQVVVVCKRQAGWRAVKIFSELTGIKVFTKKYPAGILTNTQLPGFFETDLVVICDPWLDKNALQDAVRVNTKIMIIADTNNFTKHGHQLVIGNNKSSKSLGLMFYLMTKGYLNAKGIDKRVPELEFFEVEEEEDVKRTPLKPMLKPRRDKEDEIVLEPLEEKKEKQIMVEEKLEKEPITEDKSEDAEMLVETA